MPVKMNAFKAFNNNLISSKNLVIIKNMPGLHKSCNCNHNVYLHDLLFLNFISFIRYMIYSSVRNIRKAES